MNVLVTRPGERGQILTEMFNQQHIFAIHQPLFQIEAGRELPQLPSILSQLNEGDCIFAVSKHAIDFAHQTLYETGFNWREDIYYFAVGRSSAQHFSAKSAQVVRYPIEMENSEGVLELPELQQLTGKKLIILRAETGRDFLAQQAINRGALVQYVECYQRKPITNNISEQISLAKRAGIDTIVTTSGEILNSLYEQTLDEDKDWLIKCHLVVVSKRLVYLAKRLGWSSENILLSEKADNQSIFDLLSANIT